eukprot:GHVR01172904.1.p1 GENE.GHVR01172904.1~~GHVR01172904.1.p1  ORF type:complete len:230 (+),score=75.18 GHVR01172904.1:362-1051(+)
MMTLLSTALLSRLLPGKFVALFIKKIIRVACIVNASTCVWLLTFAYKIMKKNKESCRPLIDIPREAALLITYCNGDSFLNNNNNNNNNNTHTDAYIKKESLKETSKETSKETPKETLKETSKETLKESLKETLSEEEVTRVDDMRMTCEVSLWELKLLLKHSSHTVRNIAKIFLCDFFKNDQVVLDIASVSEGALSRSLFRHRLRHTPSVGGSHTLPQDAKMLLDCCHR